MELHDKKPYVNQTYLEKNTDICSVRSEVVWGYWVMFDNEKIGVMKKDKILSFNFEEANDVADTLGRVHGEEFKKELLDIFEMFKFMKRGGKRKWKL